MHVTLKFMMDLERRGHQTNKLLKLFQQAIKQLASSKMPTIQTNATTSALTTLRCFLRLKFHHQNPSTTTLQTAFKDHCLPIFEEHNAPINTLTVANHSNESISQFVKVNHLKDTVNTTPEASTPDVT